MQDVTGCGLSCSSLSGLGCAAAIPQQSHTCSRIKGCVCSRRVEQGWEQTHWLRRMAAGVAATQKDQYIAAALCPLVTE